MFCLQEMLRWYKQVSRTFRWRKAIGYFDCVLKLLGLGQSTYCFELYPFTKIVFRSCLSKARSKAVQFSLKRLYSVFDIARTAYTNRYVLIIWKHLFKSIALLGNLRGSLK